MSIQMPQLLKGGPILADSGESVADDVTVFREENGYTPELAVVVPGAAAPSMACLRNILDGARSSASAGGSWSSRATAAVTT